MNASNAKDYLPLVQALAEGRVIQAKYQVGMDAFGWRDCEGNISFHGLAENYRIKPEPREIWLNHHKDGGLDRYVYTSEAAAGNGLRDDWAPVRYREVLE